MSSLSSSLAKLSLGESKKQAVQDKPELLRGASDGGRYLKSKTKMFLALGEQHRRKRITDSEQIVIKELLLSSDPRAVKRGADKLAAILLDLPEPLAAVVLREVRGRRRGDRVKGADDARALCRALTRQSPGAPSARLLGTFSGYSKSYFSGKNSESLVAAVVWLGL